MSGEVVVQDVEDVEATEVFPTTPGMSKEEAEALFQSMLDEPTPIETLVMSMNEEISLARNKVLLDLRADTEFVLHACTLSQPIPSHVDYETGKHVVKLDLLCGFALYSSLRCIPTNQQDGNIDNIVVLRFKEASMADADALLYSHNYFVWKQDGMYLASMGGIIGALFQPAVPSRHYSREEIANLSHLKNRQVVFFKFDDVASA